jgi:heme-degrading monooxygenase HmoA
VGFVRTITYTFGPERITELQKGRELFLRLVAANKSICQNSPGLLDTGVWISQEDDGNIHVLSYSEWDSIEDLEAFAGSPVTRRQERIIGQAATAAPPRVHTYEIMG